MPRSWEFDLPTRIIFGRGSLKGLGDTVREYGARALVVGYGDRAGMEGAYASAAKTLAQAGVAAAEFYEVTPDPPIALPVEGARRSTEAGAEVVVALGGGSVIDTAKAVALLARLGGNLLDYCDVADSPCAVSDALPVVAVPTTAGTGSEVSSVAVFTCGEAAATPGVPLKTSVSAAAIRPKVALVDPDLSLGSPAALTAACGADALGHSIEACLSRAANPVSSLLAGRAVGLIFGHLRRAIDDPNDSEAREALALAATLAGAAFDAAGVVVPHALAHALGAVLHVPHGVGVAMGTRISLRYNAERCAQAYAELADCCGIRDGSPHDRADRFVSAIDELLRAVGLPERVNVPSDALPDLLDRLVHSALAGAGTPIKLNPRKVDQPALRRMFQELLATEP